MADFSLICIELGQGFAFFHKNDSIFISYFHMKMGYLSNFLNLFIL
jgi:hypothetical protein